MRRIPAQTDLQILEGLAAGYNNNQLAKMYNVSPSYISKVKNGKKVPYIHISNPTMIKDEYFEVYNTDMTDVLNYLYSKDLIVNKKEIIEYLEVQMKKCIIKAKMFQEIIRRIGNDTRTNNKVDE